MASSDRNSNLFSAGNSSQNQDAVNKAEKLYTAGLDYYEKARYAEAVDLFEDVLKLNSQHKDANKYIGQALFYLEDYGSAVTHLSQLIQLEPENEQLLGLMGKACLNLKKYSDAEHYQRRVIAVNPRSADGYRNLGMIYYRRGLYTEAIGMLKKSLELNHSDPETFLDLGEAYNKLDEINLAVSCFEKVLEFQQDNPKVFYNLGILYDKKGMPEKASLMYRKAKELTSPRAAKRKTVPLIDAESRGLFFSRSLVVVTEDPEGEKKQDLLKKERFNKFKRRQMRKKLNKMTVPNVVSPIENVGTMDLTKASLKINEAIKIIKDKKK